VERRLGEAIMVQGRRDPEYINDADLSQYLNEMGRKIAAFAPGGAPQVDVFGVRNPVVNAFAMPGGFIGVQTGLIVLAGAESELAGVVAHEIAHVTQRHIARGLTQQTQGGHLALATLVAAILAAMLPGGGQAAMGIAAFGQAAMIDRQLGFSRDAEQEADRTGVEMLRKAGYDPNGMALMFGRLMNASSLNEGRGGGVYATTHPLSIQRMTDMQNRIRQYPSGKFQASEEFWFVRAKARVLQALDPRALRQALDQLEEEARAPGGQAGAGEST
jgi:predicted Zn-dependent protease